jgi:RNA polymerase sigma-70 factor (ECF subfamily)
MGAGVRNLIDAHYDSLYRYAYRLSGSTADAEDLTQDTFSKALTRLNQLRDQDRAKAWLFRILRNLYLHRMRDRQRHKFVPLDAVGEPAYEEAGTLSDVDPLRLQEALNELDESFRTPLILFYFEEFSYKEIADQMELPIGTVMSRLARGKAYLRAKLAPAKADGQMKATHDL